MDRGTAYDEDIYAWAYEQTEVLRRLAETRRDLPNELDIENICEEIEGVARTELREAESFLRQLLVHVLKLASAPEAPAVNHWRVEAEVFQDGFEDAATRTILRKVRTARVWRVALKQAGDQLASEGNAILSGLPAELPLVLADLANERFDIDAAVDGIRRSASPPLP